MHEPRSEPPIDALYVDDDASAEACWRTAGADDATLVVEGQPAIRADASRLRRLLENLFRNSVEHGSTTSRTASGDSDSTADDDLTVTLGALTDGFYVEDDGSGLPDDGDVFEAGYTTGTDGAGLGLAIVKRIAEEHGWSVAAVTADGGGARFEFRGV